MTSARGWSVITKTGEASASRPPIDWPDPGQYLAATLPVQGPAAGSVPAFVAAADRNREAGGIASIRHRLGPELIAAKSATTRNAPFAMIFICPTSTVTRSADAVVGPFGWAGTTMMCSKGCITCASTTNSSTICPTRMSTQTRTVVFRAVHRLRQLHSTDRMVSAVRAASTASRSANLETATVGAADSGRRRRSPSTIEQRRQQAVRLRTLRDRSRAAPRPCPGRSPEPSSRGPRPTRSHRPAQ